MAEAKVEIREYGGGSIYSQSATLVVVDLVDEKISVSMTPQGILEVESYDAEGTVLSTKHFDLRELVRQ